MAAIPKHGEAQSVSDAGAAAPGGADDTITIFGIVIHVTLAPYLYAAIAVIVYDDAEVEGNKQVIDALRTLGDEVASQETAPGMEALAKEAKATVKALREFDDIPEPTESIEFLETQAAPASQAHLLVIELIIRRMVLRIPRDEPDQIIMVPGPLQDAMNALNPHRNPYADARIGPGPGPGRLQDAADTSHQLAADLNAAQDENAALRAQIASLRKGGASSQKK